jgi:hypothetical protein
MRRKRATSVSPTASASATRRLRLLRLPLLAFALLAIAAVLRRHVSAPARRSVSEPDPLPCGAAPSDLTAGRWVATPRPVPAPLYSATCPFHSGSYNCLRNGRPPLAALSWAPARCGVVPRIDPSAFLAAAAGRRVGLVGDSLSENLAIALLCALRSADPNARRWKRRGAWRGGYFPRHDVTVAFHRAVLLAKYT